MAPAGAELRPAAFAALLPACTADAVPRLKFQLQDACKNISLLSMNGTLQCWPCVSGCWLAADGVPITRLSAGAKLGGVEVSIAILVATLRHGLVELWAATTLLPNPWMHMMVSKLQSGGLGLE